MRFSLPAIALRRPVTVFMLALSILGLGLIARQRIPLEFLPRTDIPFIICFIPYPGATPEQVENEIAIPAEGEFRTVSQLRRIRTTSDSNGCTVHMDFDWNADMAGAAADVRDRMERLKMQLPSSVDRLHLQRWSSDSLPIMVFTVTSPMDYEEFAHTARTALRSRLLRIEGVADVQIHTKPEKEILIEFDQAQLRSNNLGLYQVVSTLQTSNINVSVGELPVSSSKHFVRVLGEYRDPDDIANLVVGPNGLRLKNVADVGYQSRAMDRDYAIDGQEGVVVLVLKEAEANTVAVCEAVQTELDEMGHDPLFADMDTFVIFDQSDIITSALNALLDAGKYGGMLALLVLFLFLRRIRPTLLVAAAIPTSIVGAFVYMFFAGMSLNLVTMISMLVALGMLVDNSIVVIENIYRYNQLGLDPSESARRGATEVGLAITAATSTTLVVFVPILYLESGQMATYMKQFGIPITVSLVASLVIALTLIPLSASYMKELGKTHQHPLMDRVARGLQRMTGDRWWSRLQFVNRIHPIALLIDGYIWTLAWVLRWRLASVLVLASIAVITLVIPYQHISFSREPQQDRRQVDINLSFDQNVGMEQAREIVTRLEEVIEERRSELGIRNIFSQYSANNGSFMLFLKQQDDLRPGETLSYTTDEVRDILWKSLPERLPGVELRFQVAQADDGAQRIQIRLRGDDAATLASYAEDLRDVLRTLVPELDEVTTEERSETQELQVRVDEILAGEAGVPPMTIAQTVDFSLRGARLPYLKQGSREVPVWAQFREEDRRTRANLENVDIQTERGDLIPLSRLVDFRKANTPEAIRRVDGKNVTTITATTRSQEFNRVSNNIREVISRFQLPPGYTIELGDSVADMDTDIANFILSLMLSCILIYLVMGALFESWLLPLSILWSIPLAFVGVVWMMYLTDTSFDSVALIGMILMTGIVVNNGIVIIDHINQLRNGGMERVASIIQAGRDRFRPVMMTALTTILGCVPIALGGAFGAEITFQSLGRTLIGGLTTGTLLTLLVVPLVYTFVDDIRVTIVQFFADIAGCKRLALHVRREP